MSDNTGLPIDLGELEPREDKLVLFYKNKIGNFAVLRTYTRSNDVVREVEKEFGYNYPTHSDPEGEWEVIHEHTHSYDLAEDNETLVGDGSNWDGEGRNWREYFKDRHRYHLTLRFPHDPISEDPEEYRVTTTENSHATPTSVGA